MNLIENIEKNIREIDLILKQKNSISIREHLKLLIETFRKNEIMYIEEYDFYLLQDKIYYIISNKLEQHSGNIINTILKYGLENTNYDKLEYNFQLNSSSFKTIYYNVIKKEILEILENFDELKVINIYFYINIFINNISDDYNLYLTELLKKSNIIYVEKNIIDFVR